MSQRICSLDDEARETCDTSCSSLQHGVAWNETYCCPDERLCYGEGDAELEDAHGGSGSKSGPCPYHQCRVPVLREIHSYVRPASRILTFIAYLSGMMIILTCLLICYNPRDEIEVELLKTGVMTDSDLQTIRKLKSMKKFDGNGSRKRTIDLRSIQDESVRNAGFSIETGGTRARTARHSRVSPTSPSHDNA